MAEDDERRKVDKSVEREFSQQRNDQSILLDALEGLSAGMSPVQPSPAIAKPRRDRTVSWDINVPADLIDAPPNHDLSPVTPPQSSNVTTGKLSLKDIKDSSPIEDEAESYIHRALEESDPTRSGESEAQKNLLGAEVPKYRFEDAPSSPVPSTSSKASQKSHVSKSHRKTLSTGDALFNLAAEMRQMQNQSVSESFDGVKNGTTSADMFATNAITLMKRNKAKKEEETKSAAAVAAVRETFDPASKWKKLRTAVRASNMVDSKKTDEAVDPLENDDGDQQVDLESGVSGKGETKQNSSDNLRRSKKKSQINEDFKSDFQDFEEWLKFRKGNALRFVKNVLFFIIFPATGIAAILFYLADNPPCGSQEECIAEQHPVDVKTPMPVANTTDPGDSGLGSIGNFFRVDRSNQASASFWILFIGVRQVITFSLAKMSQAVVIDFFALRTRLFVKVLGPYATLWTVQSRGWPFLLTWWVLYDFFLLFGNNKFARHWLFWQDTIGLFNFENPAGGVLNSKAYQTVLILAASIGVAITAKRFWVGLFLGRQTFDRYANDLAVIMRKALLVGQIATLARDMEKYDFSMNDYHVEHSVAYKKTMEQNVAELDGGESVGSGGNASKSQRSILASTVDYNASIRVKINEVLGAWEEPTLLDKSNDIVSISSIIQFRQSLSCLNTTFPFSVAFGPADSRTTCISSVETVYQRLLGRTPSNEALNFDVLALVAVDRDGSLDEAKLKEVVKIFRPDREGNLSLIDFAKSVDSVYKELRLLRASVANSSKMDKAFERIINILFYFIVGCISLGVMGVDPLALFGSVSAFVLGFAFMIGAACSKYFEGLLLILVRRPFDIGDRIHVSDVNNDTSFSGSPTWFVRDVTLFATTVVFAATNEVATYSNGSLASSRIINAARSPQAVLYFNLKFPINTPYSKFKIFKAALEKFVKARPRQWLSFSAFRATRVEADAGFVEYIVVGQHRESWQNVGALLDSKAELSSFALELSKRMNMRYRAPPLPVDLSMRAAGNGGPLNDMLAQQMQAGDQFGSSDGDGANEDGSQSTYDIGAIESMFEKPK